MTTFSGPMFAPAEDAFSRSIFRKEGGHYNISAIKDGRGMDVLRRVFPKGEADECNVVLFSTSGIHGSYLTIEYAEAWVPSDDEPDRPDVTVLVVHPRVVAMIYGTVTPETPEDFAFLKRLRETSWAVLGRIGREKGVMGAIADEKALGDLLARIRATTWNDEHDREEFVLSRPAAIALLSRFGTGAGEWTREADEMRSALFSTTSTEQRTTTGQRTSNT